MSSVWSRVGIGSMTVVWRFAFSPARRTADFTWALATGNAYSIPFSAALPWIDDGRQSVRRLDLRAHALERLGDAIHGPRSQRLVAGHLEAALLAGEDPGQESHQRAGVPGVDRLVGSPKAAHPDAVDDELVVGDVVDLNPERPHGVDGRPSVGGASEAANVRLALAERTDEHRAM